MASSVMNYKCPCCSAALAFHGGSGKLKCDSCGNSFELEAVQQAQEVLENTNTALEHDWQVSPGAWSDAEMAQVQSYSCPSCGAEIVVDKTVTALECVYCGNATILSDRLSGGGRPDAVIPFVKSEDDARKAYLGLLKGKKLLPRDFAGKNRIQKIAGVYVPFWMFDCDTDADISYDAERNFVHREGKYEVIDTDHYLVLRGGRLGFADVPVDASSKFDDTLMEAVEPFDMGRQADFSTGYLPGYQAERYDVDAETAKPRADERIRTSVEDAFRATVSGFDSVRTRTSSVRIRQGRVRNVLAPVWMLNTKWKDQNYVFAMNGQSGRMVGNLPIDRGRLVAWAAGLFFGLSAAGFLVLYLLYATGVI